MKLLFGDLSHKKVAPSIFEEIILYSTAENAPFTGLSELEQFYRPWAHLLTRQSRNTRKILALEKLQ